MATDPRSALLGIDLGTSSVKVALTSTDGKVFAETAAAYAVSHPGPGWAETHPNHWWTATCAATGAVLSARPDLEVVGIGLSGQMHGVVTVDERGRPTRNAILWADTRAQPQVAAYNLLPDVIRAGLANPPSPGMAGPVLGWLAEHEPATVAATRWALQPKDWIRLRLVDAAATEPSDASATLLYSLADDGWDDTVVASLGIDPAILPMILPTSGTFAGPLTSLAAADLGLRSGLPIAAGAADAAAAALGSGLTKTGDVQLTIGTGIQLVTPLNGPVLPEPGAGWPVVHCYRAATDMGHYAMAASLNGGSTLGWVREILGVSWAELYAAANYRPAGGEGLVFLPHLHGERTPHLDPTMRGGWIGLSSEHTRTDLLHAALLGVACAAREALDALVAIQPAAAVGPLRLAGGGTASAPWRQLVADVLGRELAAVEVPSASARGAAFLGGRAAGVITDPDRSAFRAELGAIMTPSPDTALWRDRTFAAFQAALSSQRPAPTPTGDPPRPNATSYSERLFPPSGPQQRD
jgi:xylulokinase